MVTRALISLTFFALPWYVVRFTVFGLPTTLLEMVLLATLAVWLLDKARTRNFPTLNTQWRAPIGLFLLASIIALFTAPQFLPALGHWRAYILEPILFALVLIDTIKTERDRTHVIYALAASLVIPVAIALYQQMTGLGIPEPFWAAEATRRVTSIYGYPNALGLYAVPILILIIPQVIKSESHSVIRLMLALVSCATIAAVVFTRSKGALIALVAGIAVFFLLIARRKVLAAGALIVIAAIGIFVVKGSFNLRGIATVQGGDSVSVRLTQYRETWEMLKDHPFTGAGLRGYQTAMAPYHAQKYIEIFMYPHNIFLTVWSELGLIGLIAFVWVIIQFCKISFHSTQLTNSQTHKLINYATIAAMSALLVHGFVDVPYFKNDLAVLFWILIAFSIPLFTDRQQLKNMLQ